MFKQDFINEIQAKLDGKTKKECAEFIDAFQEVVYEALSRGDEVRIAGFGTFKTRKIAAHEGVDPRTKKKITINETVVPSFKVGSAFKAAVRG